MDDLRDLLLASMQNTISLTELATQQTSKISTITLALNEAKSQIEHLQADLLTAKTKINELAENEALPTWPEGSYCILASGACPPGFTRYSGYIRAFNTYSYNSNYIQAAAFGDSYMGCHGDCGRNTHWDAEFGITSCCK